MKKAYNKDIWRTIWKGKKRFFAIMLITVLGVTMLTGLKAACVDLRVSADQFYDAQNLFDISIVSTLGLTGEDVEVLAQMEEIKDAEGAYSETVHTKIKEKNATAQVKTISREGINMPYIVEGALPAAADEIVVTEEYILNSGKKIGDTVVIEEDMEEDSEETEDEKTESGEEFEVDIEEEKETPNFLHTIYKISGVVVDVADINNPNGSVSFRTTSAAEYTFFVLPEAVDSEVYTAVHLTISGAKEMFCYSDAYEECVEDVVGVIEDQIKTQREQARYDAITGEALEKVADAETEINEKFAEAEDEIAEAEQDIAEGWKELEDGEQELNEKEKEANDEFAKAYQELEDAKQEIRKGEEDLSDGWKQFYEGESQLVQGKQVLAEEQEKATKQLEDAKNALDAQEVQTKKAYQELEIQEIQVEQSFQNLWPKMQWDELCQAAEEAYLPIVKLQMKLAEYEQQLAEAEAGSDAYEKISKQETAAKEQLQQAQMSFAEKVKAKQDAFAQEISESIEMAKQGIDYQILILDPSAENYKDTVESLNRQKEDMNKLKEQLPELAMGKGQLAATQQVLVGQKQAVEEQNAEAEKKFQEAWAEIQKNEETLAGVKQQLLDASAQLDRRKAELEDGEEELLKQETEAKEKIAEGKAELEDGRKELLDGEQELSENKETYEKNKKKAEDKIAEAKEEIFELDMTQWYVQDRSSLSGYANVKSDAGSIEAIGTVFPIVFFIVAILISLTTITRMVEEDRGLIGTYKALGFKDSEIQRKYLLYACAASLAGGIVGDIGGFIVLPKIIFLIFGTMYLLPEYVFQFDALYGFGGIGLFVFGITAATGIACQAELRNMPAALMRPKAPRSGSRVFLERIKPLWNRLSFLNKVTARNLFRYKKRLLMTIAGIMGCTALLLFGFAIKDSVTDLMPRQYEQVYQYDLMAVWAADDNEEQLSYMEAEEIEEYLNLQVESVKVKNAEGEEEHIQMFVVPKGVSLEGYIHLESIEDEAIDMKDEGIYLTQNAANILGIEKGDNIFVQDLSLDQHEFEVCALVKNYLGNSVYMTQNVYENTFGEYEPNGVLVDLSDTCTDPIAFAGALGEKDGMMSSVSTEELRRDFSKAFTLINMVVYIVIIMAAALAFVVLFTLSTTNISERCRELATIKVLGFYDREVHLYVNKETLILTMIGIVLGMPLGRAFASTLTAILNLPSIYLAVSLHGVSYAIAGALSLGFALIVNMITDRSLDKIDPVEALKSVE